MSGDGKLTEKIREALRASGASQVIAVHEGYGAEWAVQAHEDPLLDALAPLIAAEDRATQAEAERDEWRQAALEERAGLLDALDQLKVRDTRIRAAVAILDEDTRWQNEEHLLARVRAALTA